MRHITAITGLPPAAIASQTDAVRAGRRELACLDLEITVRAKAADARNPSINLLRLADTVRGWKRFDEMATVPGSL